MAKYLFVGGAADGQKMTANKEIVRIFIREKESKSHLDFRYEVYKAFRIAGQSQIFTVYGLEDLSIDCIIRSLIDNYNLQKSDIS